MIFITGDTHGDIKRFSFSNTKHIKSGDTLIICGDFGFIWDNSPEEIKNLNKLSNKKYNIYFVDGVHENFELLESYPRVELCGGYARKISDNIFYLERGEIFNIEDKSFFVFGGGEDPDIHLKTEPESLKKRSMPSLEEMRFGAENLRSYDFSVDYIITHSPCPSTLNYQRKLNTNNLDIFFEGIERKVLYKKWFFGSTHLNRSYATKAEAVYTNISEIY